MSARQTTLITPIGTLVALTTGFISILGQNPSRKALMFHNPNATGNVIVQVGTAQILIFPAGYSPVFSGDTCWTAGASAAMSLGTGNVSVLEWQ